MLQATGGTKIDQVYTTLRIIDQSNSTGPSSGSLIVEGGASIAKNVYIDQDLFIPNGAVSTSSFKLSTSPVINYTLKCIDTSGTGIWAVTKDYRLAEELNSIGIHGLNLGIGITNAEYPLSVSGTIQTFGNLLLESVSTNVTFNQLNFNSGKVLIDASGNIGLNTTIAEQLNLSGNLRLEGHLMNNGNSFDFPPASGELVGTSGAQSLSDKTLVNGVLSGNLNATGSKIINLGTPTSSGDAANKEYVDSLLLGLDWKESVLSKNVIDAPISPLEGDSYLLITVTGTFTGHENDIARFRNGSWVYITPTNGAAVLVEDTEQQWNFNGTDWVLFGTLVSHSNLLDLDQDTHQQYALLQGRGDSQTLIGGTTSLVLLGSSTGGNILLGPTNGRVGINITDPASALHVRETFAISDFTMTQTGTTMTIKTNNKPLLELNDNSTKLLIGATEPTNFVKIVSQIDSGILLNTTSSETNIHLSGNLLEIANSGVVKVTSQNVSIGSVVTPNAKLVIGDYNLGTHQGLTTPSIVLGTTGAVVSISEAIVNSSTNLILNSNGNNVGIGVTTPSEVLEVSGNIKLSGVLKRNSEIFTLPAITDTLVGTSNTAVLYNKTLEDTTTTFFQSGNVNRTVQIQVSGSGSSNTMISVPSTNKTITFPDITDTIVTKNSSDILTNKNFVDTSCNFVNSLDNTKKILFNITGNVTGSTLELVSVCTTSKTITFPDITDTIVTKNSQDVLTNKILVEPSVSGVCTFESDVIIKGDIYQRGTVTILDSTVVNVGDNLIKLADGNVSSDVIDTGFYSVYSELGTTKYTGIYRNHTDKLYTFFENVTTQPGLTIGTTNYSGIRVSTVYTPEMNGNVHLIGSLGINQVPVNDFDVSGSVNFNNIVGITSAGINVSGKVDIQSVPRILSGTVDTLGMSVTGTSSFFTTEASVGDLITINSETSVIVSISSNTLLTVNSVLTTSSSQTATINPSPFSCNDLVLNASGYLGIGTNLPGFPLTITSSTNGWSQKITNNQSVLFLGNNSGEGININTGTLNNSSYSLLCANGISGTQFKVQADGYVGIRTGSPSELLEIYGNSAGDGAQIGNLKMGVWSGNTASTALVHSNLKATDSSYFIRQHSSGDTTLNAASSKSIFLSIADTQKGILTSTGRLGIGTTTPDSTLHILGTAHISSNLTVDGNLYLSGTAAQLNISQLTIDDNVIKLADNNSTDVVDIGFFGQYNSSFYAGLYRDHTDGTFKFFKDLNVEPGTTSIPFNGSGYLDASIRIGNLIASGGTLFLPTEITSNTTLTADMSFVLVSGTVTITIPRGRTADSFVGTKFTIVNIGTGTVTLITSNTDLIDNQTGVVYLYNTYDRISVYNIGSDLQNASNGIWLSF